MQSRVFGAMSTGTDGRYGGAEALLRSRSRQQWDAIDGSFAGSGHVCDRHALVNLATTAYSLASTVKRDRSGGHRGGVSLSVTKNGEAPNSPETLDRNTSHGRVQKLVSV